METTNYNLLAIILGVVSILISAVAIIASLTSSLVSNLNSTTANEIAKKALKIATFNHGGDIIPDISIKFYAGSFFGEEVRCVLLVKNHKRGKAIIENIDGHFVKVLKSEKIKFPCEILLNGIEIFDAHIPAVDHSWVSKKADELNISRKTSYIDSYKSIAEGGHFVVYFIDSVGNRYSSFLEFNKELKEFVGKPRQLKRDEGLFN